MTVRNARARLGKDKKQIPRGNDRKKCKDNGDGKGERFGVTGFV
jgi:hypothetical protein